mmetsp:Transcript_22935/g.53677  ORF Transcript_22935/g.53677 Transcript_22935/m.53677 type:complete len:98 (-) Transcript_22935:12-305(-)
MVPSSMCMSMTGVTSGAAEVSLTSRPHVSQPDGDHGAGEAQPRGSESLRARARLERLVRAPDKEGKHPSKQDGTESSPIFIGSSVAFKCTTVCLRKY